MGAVEMEPRQMRKRIPVAGPAITDEEVALVADAARNSWYENATTYISQFERMVADYTGSKYAIAVSHATSALHLAFATLGLKEGDEVIAPDVTWIASVAPIYQTGAEAVLVDITPDTWCIDPEAVRRAITPRTKAILGVDIYGSVCDWPALEAIAREHGLKIVEDAAEALGSSLNGKRAGSFGDFSILSFHGSKIVTTGEGGMLLTNSEELYKRALFLRDHGRTNVSGHYQMFFNTEIAFKYKLSALQAALGVGQMRRIDALVEHKRNTFEWYRKRLQGINGITLNVEPKGVYNTFWMPTVVLDPSMGVTRNDVMDGLDARNVDTRPMFTPLSEMPAFVTHKPSQRYAQSNVVSQRIAHYGINLPSSALTTEDDVDYICSALLEIIRSGEAKKTATA
jgi:perosamine synthetase